MSGGAYGYVASVRFGLTAVPNEWEWEDELKNIAERLEKLGCRDAAEVTRLTQVVADTLNGLYKSTFDLWYALEWWDSGDWSEDDFWAAYREWRDKSFWARP